MLFCRDTRPKMSTSGAIKLLLGLAGALVVFSFRDSAFAEISLAEAQGRYANSTVFIAVRYETLDGQTPTSGCKKGSGFLISESGYVVTSYHLFTDEKHRPFDKINAVLGKVGESFDCDQPLGDVVRLDRVMSLAEVDAQLLKVVSPKPYVPIPACLGPAVANGSPLYVLGFPLGLPLAPQQVIKGNDTGKLWQISGQFDTGSSGGPVISPRGTLAGLVFGSYERTNVSYVVPLSHFSSFFQIAGVPLERCTNGADGSRMRDRVQLTIFKKPNFGDAEVRKLKSILDRRIFNINLRVSPRSFACKPANALFLNSKYVPPVRVQQALRALKEVGFHPETLQIERDLISGQDVQIQIGHMELKSDDGLLDESEIDALVTLPPEKFWDGIYKRNGVSVLDEPVAQYRGVAAPGECVSDMTDLEDAAR